MSVSESLRPHSAGVPSLHLHRAPCRWHSGLTSRSSGRGIDKVQARKDIAVVVDKVAGGKRGQRAAQLKR